MKADVPPAITAAPHLEVPAWVPEPIAQSVRAKYAADVDWAYRAALKESGDVSGSDEYLAAVARQDEVREAFADWVRDDLADINERYLPLVCDQRMRGVWRELSRQRQGTFLHPACPPSGANAKERQEEAMVEIFSTALECQNSRAATTTRGKAERQRKHHLEGARELCSDALTMMTQPLLFCGQSILTDRQRLEFWRKLNDAADAHKEYTRALQTAQFCMPEREHDGRAHWVALIIGEKFRALFGSPMYGLTATITSVVLGRQIDPRTVRQWCAPNPAVKPRKIVP
jgi:hypothetical protein